MIRKLLRIQITIIKVRLSVLMLLNQHLARKASKRSAEVMRSSICGEHIIKVTLIRTWIKLSGISRRLNNGSKNDQPI